VRFSTGLPELDDLLGGGIPIRSLTLIYGDEKSGKTSLALRICASAAKRSSAAYIDCSGRLHPARLLQVFEANKVDEERVSVLLVENFLHQEEVIMRIYDGDVPAPLIVFDDFTHLHRLELKGEIELDLDVYRRLAFQVAALKEAALKRDLSIIIIGQVHAIPDKGETRAVAHRILTYWSDYVLRIEKRDGERCSMMRVEKPRRDKSIRFRIVRSGIAPC